MLKNLNLKQKTIAFFSIMLILSSIICGYVSYNIANDGFTETLSLKACSDTRMALEILDNLNSSHYEIKDNKLVKGNIVFNGNNDITEKLKLLTGNNVTIFAGSTRVATTFIKQDGTRAVGTQCSTEIAKEVLSIGNDYAGYADVLGVKYYSVYTPLKDKNGKPIGMLFMGIPTEVVQSIQSTFIKEVSLAVGLVIVLICVLSFFIIRRSIKPLEVATEELSIIADGDLTRENLVVKSNDEVGKIITAINHMKASISSFMQDVSNTSQQLAASAEELTAQSQQTAETIKQVADASCSMAESAQQQLDTVDKMNSEANNIISAMENIETVAENMNDMANTTENGTKKGIEIGSLAVEKINSMTEQIAVASTQIDALGKKAEEIEGIVHTVSEIASQTNLLALNAAIEAAHAGDAGKGFAVVAEEIRKLAEQSAQSAKDIAQLIEEVETEVTNVITAMKKVTTDVEDSTKAVEQSGNEFSVIGNLVIELRKSISNSISSIDESVTQIHGFVTELKEVSQLSAKTTSEAQNVSASTEEQASTMSEMSEASVLLADMAQTLQDGISKFKV